MSKMFAGRFITIVIIFLMLGCEGPAGPTGVQGTAGKDGGYDKQIRFEFDINGSLQTQDTLGILTSDKYNIIKFDKRNYLYVDSIVFLAFLRSTDSTVACQLVLVNITDNKNVDSSLIQTTKTTNTLVVSKNIYSTLPSSEVTLAVKLLTSKQSVTVEASKPTIFLFRR